MNRFSGSASPVCPTQPARCHSASSAVVCEQPDARASIRLMGGWVLLSIIASVCLLTAQAFGQAAAPKSIPLNEALTARPAIALMERAKNEGLFKADFSTEWAGYPEFRKYYQQYQFGKLMDARYVKEYGNIAQSLLEDLDRSQKSRGPAARTLGGWIVAGSRAIALGDFHPVARVNATLMLAHVDDQPADLRAGRPPVPASAALPLLVQLYRAETSPDGVRAAALQGILRHVQMGAVTDPAYRDGIARIALALAESDPPAGRSPEAHAFLQRYALDLLATLADPNTSAKTADTLVSISTRADKPNLIAAYAAAQVGRFQPGKAKVNQTPDVLKSWAARAAGTVDSEIQRIARLDPPVAVRDQPAMPTEATRAGGGYEDGYDPGGGDMPGMMDMGDMGEMYDGGMGEMMDFGGMGMPGMMMGSRAQPQPLEVVTARRSINHLLQQLQFGVTGQRTAGMPRQPGGLLAATDPAERAAVESWVTKVGDVVAAINDTALDDRKKFVEELEKQSQELKKLAGIAVARPGAASGRRTVRKPADPSLPGNLSVAGPNLGEESFDADEPDAMMPEPDPSDALGGNDPDDLSGVDPLGDPGVMPIGEPGADPIGEPGVDPLAEPGIDPLGADPLAEPGVDPLGEPGVDPIE